MNTHCGYIAIIGRPNVGKSTLLNKILQQKVSITSKKPQTTRHKILGIKTEGENQAIYVDTPGMHLNPKHTINRMMINAAISTLTDVDVVIFVVDARRWKSEDDFVLSQIAEIKLPIIVVLNKIDRIEDHDNILPILKIMQERLHNVGLKNVPLIPLSAKSGNNVNQLEEVVAKYLPENPFFFDADQVTDRNDRFLASEIIREKLMRYLGDEVPHELAVEIQSFQEKNHVLHIHAIIWVERDGQKIIVIGKSGEGLKNVGTLARKDMENVFGEKVFLQLWVKIKRGWSDNERALKSLGYSD